MSLLWNGITYTFNLAAPMHTMHQSAVLAYKTPVTLITYHGGCNKITEALIGAVGIPFLCVGLNAYRARSCYSEYAATHTERAVGSLRGAAKTNRSFLFPDPESPVFQYAFCCGSSPTWLCIRIQLGCSPLPAGRRQGL